jgi:enoyl-CoA hydratase/carnithine racemase
MNSAEEALALGLVDKVVSAEDMDGEALGAAHELAGWDAFAFGSVKRLLRNEALERIESHEKGSVSDFVDIWYSEKTREKLKKIEIRS